MTFLLLGLLMIYYRWWNYTSHHHIFSAGMCIFAGANMLRSNYVFICDPLKPQWNFCSIGAVPSIFPSILIIPVYIGNTEVLRSIRIKRKFTYQKYVFTFFFIICAIKSSFEVIPFIIHTLSSIAFQSLSITRKFIHKNSIS